MEEKKVTDKLKQFWDSKNSTTKRSIVFSAVILVVLIASLIYLYSKDNYEFLLSTTDKTASAKVLNQLKEENIKYDVKGDSIYVSGVNPDSLRLELAGNGYLESDTSNLELFSSPLFISEKQEEKIIQKDLESNISSAIKSYNEVSDAKVILTMGSQSSFKNDNVPATAAIQLKLKSNLSSKQVKSIQEFVAAAVPNLSSTDVVITDTNNNLLSSNNDNTTIEDSTAYTKSLEETISSQISELLSVAFPTTNFKVVSRVQVNFDETKIEKETVSSGPDTIVSKETHSEITTNKTGNTTVGTESNVPSYETPNNSGQSITEVKDELINYELNKIKEQTKKQPTLTNVNVTVVADKSLSAIETEKIRDLVETASGYNEKRGDKVSVQGFDTEPVVEDNGGVLTFVKDNFETISTSLIILAIVIAILTVALKLINALFKKNTVEIAPPVSDDLEIDALPTDDTISTENGVDDSDYEMKKPSNEVLKKREVIQKEIDENPQQIATVFKTWLDKESKK